MAETDRKLVSLFLNKGNSYYMYQRMCLYSTLCSMGCLFSNLFQMLTECVCTRWFGSCWGCGPQCLEFGNCCIRCDASCLVNPFRNFTDSLPPLASLQNSPTNQLSNAMDAARLTYSGARMPFWSKMLLDQTDWWLTSHNLPTAVASILTNIPGGPQLA